jgi:dipeptidyl aminopeptidase/acylaminoacyl peptidase
MRSIVWIPFVSLASVVSLAVACSGKPQPPPCDPVKAPWSASAIATPYASNAPSASTSASVAPPVAAKSPFTFEQMLNVKRSLSPAALSGSDFLYLYDESGTAQVWVRRGAGAAKALTSFPDRIGGVRAAPDGKHAVFMKDQGGDENFQLHLLALDGKDEGAILALTATPKIKHTLAVFDDKGEHVAFTANARNGKDMDLHVLAVPKPGTDVKPSDKEKELVALTGSWTVEDWRGDSILLTEERSSFDQDLWIVNAKTKQKKLLTKHTGDERWYAGRFSRDGKSVFALTDAGREFVGIAVIDVASNKHTPLVEVDHDVVAFATPRWNAPYAGPKPGDKSTAAVAPPPYDVVVYDVNLDGVEQVAIATFDAKHAQTGKQDVPEAHGVISAIDVDPSGTAAYVALEDATRPPEIWRLPIGPSLAGTGASASAVTSSDHAGVDPSQLVPATLEHFTTFDGKSISYFLYEKPSGNPSAKQPCVVVVHGGPEAQAQPNFSALIEYLALSGYAVALPNVRGSTGYGKSFSHLDDKDKRLDSVKDLSELGKALGARPEIDGSRIALFGGSYGGFMVLAGLAFYPKQWAAGVDIVGIANFKTFLEQTAPYRRALREAEYGSLEKDAAMLDAISPIHKVDQIVAPLMVIHGTNDPRVPVGEAKQIAEALKKKGVPVELMIFDDEGHGLAKLKNRLVAYPAAVKFLDGHMGK